MISVARCADIAELSGSELILGIEPSERHKWLLSGYLLNKRLGRHAVLKMIVADLRRYLDLGVPARAADLLIVLRLFLSETGHGVPASAHTHPMGTALAHARRRPRMPADAGIASRHRGNLASKISL